MKKTNICFIQKHNLSFKLQWSNQYCLSCKLQVTFEQIPNLVHTNVCNDCENSWFDFLRNADE